MRGVMPTCHSAIAGLICLVVGAALLCSPRPIIAQTKPVFLPAGQGVVRALVIGVDQYDEIADLKGAAADARDFEATLRKLGVSDLTVLVNKAASRQAVWGAMQ